MFETAALTMRRDRLDFRHDGERNLLGRFRADVQARRSVDACGAVAVRPRGQVGEQALRAAAWAEDADVSRRRRQHRAQECQVVRIVVRHEHDRFPLPDGQTGGEFPWWTNDEFVHSRESCAGGVGTAAIDHPDAPTEFLAQPGKRHGVLARSTDQQRARRHTASMKISTRRPSPSW